MKKERVQQIVRAMVSTGYTDEQIAEEVGCTKGHIKKIKRDLGLTAARRDPQDDAEKMVELYKQGFTRAQIAEQLKWSYETVTRTLRVKGIGKPMPGEEQELVIVPVRKMIKPEMVIDRISGKIYYDVTALFLESEGRSIWST